MSKTATLITFPIGLVLLGFAVDYLNAFEDLRGHVGGRTPPREFVASGGTSRALRLFESGRLRGLGVSRFEPALSPLELPSTRIVRDMALPTRLPTLSIVLDSLDLQDSRSGILTHPFETGRAWERPAYVSYFEDEELRFAVGAGLRVHGGGSRRGPRMSFRLHFRDLYGTETLRSGLFFEGSELPLSSVVVRNDLRDLDQPVARRFSNVLAYDVAAAIGSLTPRSKPSQLYLNGRYQGAYIVTEHLSLENLEARFGNDDLVVAETKLDPGEINPPEYMELEDWVWNGNPTVEELAQTFDLENLTNWIIGVAYAGVTDPFQGAAVLDKSADDPRWFWVNWDMDDAFSDRWRKPAWEIDIFDRELLSGREDLRSQVFERMTGESPDYRDVFLRRSVEVLNHVITAGFLEERLAYYRELSSQMSIDDTRHLDSIGVFIAHRPAVLREQLDRYFAAGPSFRVTVSNPGSALLAVDGHEVVGDYTGYYFSDTPLNIEISGQDRAAFRSWIIDGETSSVAEPELELSVSADTHVRVVVADSRER